MWHAKSGTKHTDVPALRVLDHDVQTVEASAKGHGFLVHRVEVQRGLEERLRNIARDDVLKRLHHASADSSNASVEVEDRRVHALLAFEGKVAIPQLDGNGNQVGVGCCAQEVRTILKGELTSLAQPPESRVPLRSKSMGGRGTPWRDAASFGLDLLVHRDSFSSTIGSKLSRSLYQIFFRAFIAGVRDWRFLKKSCQGSGALNRFA